MKNETRESAVPSVALTLRYDDRYAFPDAIRKVETVSVTSTKTGTDTPDERVMRTQRDLPPNVGIACGVGRAAVTLKNGTVCLVTVTPAPLSVLLITGQSNGEGSTTGEADVYGKARNQSVVCEQGQVYSTYGWSTEGHSVTVAGLSSSRKLEVSNAGRFVAKSLTSDVSRSRRRLEYPLCSLSACGKGKTGFDSALAWNWNRLLGEKVWVVNCAAGSTYLEQWQPNAVRYENCVALMAQVRATLDAEIAAGHYSLNRFVAFWLQGESNKLTGEADYSAMLATMLRNLKKDVTLTGDRTLEGFGIVMVRAFETTNPAADTVDNGPRLAQKAAIAAKDGVFADVFLACIANDEWISDKKVSDYWERKYPGSEYPFTVHAQTYRNPTTIAEVHTGVHYLQPGYNEIGIMAARNALEYFDLLSD